MRVCRARRAAPVTALRRSIQSRVRITNQTFVGSEPTQLGQADDGQTLYVGLDAAASIRSYNILTHTAGPQFLVGRDIIHGPYSFSDIAVSPGNPSVIAVARQQRNVTPSEAGIAIFDNR